MSRAAPTIDSYGGGGFRLSGEWRDGSVLIVGDEPRSWAVAKLSDVSRDSLEPVFAAGRAEVEFLLLGVGPVNALPPREVRDSLRAAGLGLEFMDTPAAARLYNVYGGGPPARLRPHRGLTPKLRLRVPAFGEWPYT